MGTFALVIFEIQEKDKAPNVIYITYGEVDSSMPSEQEIIAWAENYVNNPNAVYKEIITLSPNQYKAILTTHILDYFFNKDIENNDL